MGLSGRIRQTKVEMGGKGSGGFKLKFPKPPSLQRAQDTIILGRCLNWCDLANHTWLFCDPFWQAVSDALNDTRITKLRCSKYRVDAVMLAKLRGQIKKLEGGEPNGNADGL